LAALTHSHDNQLNEIGQLRSNMPYSLFSSAAIFTVITLTAAWALRHFLPEKLPFSDGAVQRRVTREVYIKECAQYVTCVIMTLVLAPAGIYYAYLFETSASRELGIGDPAGFVGPEGHAIMWINIYKHTAVLGETFAGYMLFLIVFWCLGWEKGLIPLVHHTMFFTIAVYLLSHMVLPKIALLALTMEMSSLPLAVHNFSRQLNGWEITAKWSGAIFAIMFLFFRMLLFGYGSLDLLYSWVFHFGMFENLPTLPSAGAHLGVGLYQLALMLQLYWGIGIVGKVVRAC